MRWTFASAFEQHIWHFINFEHWFYEQHIWHFINFEHWFYKVNLNSLSGKTSRRKISKPRDSGLDFSSRFEIWQAPRQHRCRDARQISERYNHYNIQPRGF